VAEAKARGLALTGPHGHPPVLRALSVQHKISLRSWFRPVFRLLVAMAPGARHPSPAALANGGLKPALKALARRSAVPVRLDVHTDQRLPNRSRSPPTTPWPRR
jgi:hypothetical protein